jgi:small-conductance mechanosensitive channel
MTNGNELDEIRGILAELARSQAAHQQQTHAEFEQMRQQSQAEMTELRGLVFSNARAVEANSNAIADLRVLAQQNSADIRGGIADLTDLMTQLAEEAAADRAELRLLIEAIAGNPKNGGNGSES